MATKVVRVEIDAELWRTVRLEALTRDQTVSEYMTGVIEREVKRGRRAEHKRDARANRAGDEA